jgi:hypothetical protein
MAVCLLLLAGNACCRDGTQTDGEPFHMPRAVGLVAADRAPAGSCVTDLTLAMG